jgi:voltage-gated potassium channel
MNSLKDWCVETYYGTSSRALRARYLLLGVDLLIICYFVTTTFLEFQTWIFVVDAFIGAWLVIEFMGRLVAEDDRFTFLTRPLAVLDVCIILSLFLPATIGNYAFLRVIRALRLTRSYLVTRQLRSYSRFFATNEEIIFSTINLFVFIFVVTAVVFVLQADSNPSINNYIDALYFTITTLTTTGFGDITLVGGTGRLLAVMIMIVGVALFIRLVQAIFRPSKVRYECPTCGLTRHETDAVHCKHCGRELHIRTEGSD